MYFTDYGENMICNILRGSSVTLPATFNVGLLTEVSDSSYTEVSWTGYARVSVARSLAAWAGTQGAGTRSVSTGTSHMTSNNNVINFATVRDTATIVAVGLFADSNMVAYAPLQTQLEVQNGDVVNIQAGTLTFTLGLTGGMSDYLSNKMIDYLWRGQTFAYPSQVFIALNTSMPTNSTEGGEVAASEYARVTINTTSNAWTAPQDGTIRNAGNLTFPVPTSDWGNVVANTIYDAQTGGNMLWWAPVDSPRTIINGASSPQYMAGAISLQVM